MLNQFTEKKLRGPDIAVDERPDEGKHAGDGEQHGRKGGPHSEVANGERAGQDFLPSIFFPGLGGPHME